MDVGRERNERRTGRGRAGRINGNRNMRKGSDMTGNSDGKRTGPRAPRERPRRQVNRNRQRQNRMRNNGRNRLERAFDNRRRERNSSPMGRRNNGRFGRMGRPRFNNGFGKRKIFVQGIPKYIDNTTLFNTVRNEGRLIGCRIVYDRLGLSTGNANLEFSDPRDARRFINRWNNTTLDGRRIRVEYKRTRPFRNFDRDFPRFGPQGGYFRRDFGRRDNGRFGGDRQRDGGRGRGRGRGRGQSRFGNYY